MPTSLEDYVSSLNDQAATEAGTLIEMMRRISSCPPELWNESIIGFGTYHYKYESGREGDAHVLGFHPKKGKTTIYLMDGTARYADLLETLGKHTITGYCVYIKQLNDIDLTVLEEILQKSYDHITSLSKTGPIDRILWRNKIE